MRCGLPRRLRQGWGRLPLVRGLLERGGHPSSSPYHVSGWDGIATTQPGDHFTLRLGGQGAEGDGVYSPEGAPCYTTADGRS